MGGAMVVGGIDAPEYSALNCASEHLWKYNAA